jgi:hypothetical protein
MPFITQDRRVAIDEYGLEALTEIAPGDICYAYYKPMVEQWKAKPRWTTAHHIYKDMVRWTTSLQNPNTDNAVAYSLAWQVFFAFYVLPYEREAEKRNGTI